MKNMHSLDQNTGNDMPMVTEAPGKKEKYTPRYPSITVDAKDHPFLSKAEVGDECMVCMKIKKASHELPSQYNPTKGEKMELRLMEMGEMPEEKGQKKSTPDLDDVKKKYMVGRKKL